MEFGILLPHFGSTTSRKQLRDVTVTAEKLGFDSVWVRDHLYIPETNKVHSGVVEDTFLEGLLTLSFVSAYINEMTLGTSVLNPHRHPLKLSQNLGTLDNLTNGRIICGLGAGHFREEFEAVGVPYDERGTIVEETIEILRETFSETNTSFEGEYFEYQNVTVDPRPKDEIPIWYGGPSLSAMHRAVKHTDGWHLGRMPFEMMDKKLAKFRTLKEKYNRDTSLCSNPMFSVWHDTEAAYGMFDMDSFIQHSNRMWGTNYSNRREVEGSIIVGTPGEVIETIRRLQKRGLDHIIFDMRHSFDNMIDMMQITHDEVMTEF